MDGATGQIGTTGDDSSFSPDGHWVAYSSNETGRMEIYVQSFPEAVQKSQVSTSGGRQPRWRHDGNELFYVAVDGKLMAVEVKLGQKFSAGVSRALFDARLTDLGYPNYDVTGDGRHFLLNRGLQDPGSEPISVALNWAAALMR